MVPLNISTRVVKHAHSMIGMQFCSACIKRSVSKCSVVSYGSKITRCAVYLRRGF